MAEAAGAWTLGRLFAHARTMLGGAGAGAAPDEAAFEARLLIRNFAACDRTEMTLRPERPVTPAQLEAVLQAVGRRISGEPVHRIIGSREFYGLPLKLSAATLEPRPDTETLVDLVLPFLRERAAAQGTCRVLDLGTGTGAVALALLAAEPKALAVGSDISTQALATAAGNADMNGLSERFSTLRSSWFEVVEGRFDLIVSNPPYIASAEIAKLQREVREHDPHAALDGGADGLDAYRAIAAGARGHLAAEGRIGVEIGFGQREDVLAIFGQAGFRGCGDARDLAGRDRAIMFASPPGKHI